MNKTVIKQTVDQSSCVLVLNSNISILLQLNTSSSIIRQVMVKKDKIRQTQRVVRKKLRKIVKVAQMSYNSQIIKIHIQEQKVMKISGTKCKYYLYCSIRWQNNQEVQKIIANQKMRIWSINLLRKFRIKCIYRMRILLNIKRNLAKILNLRNLKKDRRGSLLRSILHQSQKRGKGEKQTFTSNVVSSG